MDVNAFSGEALVAVTGIFPTEPASIADGRAATLLHGKWRTAVKDFFDRDKPYRFKSTRMGMSYDKVRDMLNNPDDNPEWLASKIADEDMATAYLTVLSNAREYLRERWPALVIDQFPAPRIVEPGRVLIGKMSTLFSSVNEPTSLLDEMLSHSVQDEQVDAVKTVFPSLFSMLMQLIDERSVIELSKSKSWSVTWNKERVLRRLYQLPVQLSISEAARQPANMGKHAPSVQIQFKANEYTRSQQIGSK